MWRSELFALVRIFIAASLDVSEQRQSSSEQSCDDSRARSVDSRCCYRCLTRSQPLCKNADSCVHPRLVRKSTLISEARHANLIKPILILAVALQRAPAVTLKQTQTA